MPERSPRFGSLLTVSFIAGAAFADPAPDKVTDQRVTLGPDDFAGINAMDVQDLLRYAPDAFVGKRFAGDDAVITLRGTSPEQSARTLVMVDGFVISNFLGNGATFGPAWHIVGPSDVDHIDILHGPGSARYGGNSMGGVVSVTTREAAAKDGYLSLQGVAAPYEQYGVDETFTGYSVEAGGSWKQASSPWSARIAVRHLENVGQPATFALLAPLNGPAIVPVTGAYDDPRLPTPVFGASSPIDLVQNQFRASVGYEFKSGWKLEGLLFGWLSRQDLTDSRTFLRDASGAPVYEANVGFDGVPYDARGIRFSVDRRSDYLAGIKASGDIAGWRTSINASHYWIDTQDTRTANFYFTFSQDGGGTVSLQDDSGWWTVDAGIERWFARHRLALGIGGNQYEANRNDYQTSNWRTAAGPLFASSAAGNTRSLGVYAEDEILLDDDSALTVGVRADRWEAYDGTVAKDVNGSAALDAYADRRESSISPKLAFRTKLGSGWELAMSAGTATRFPTVGELFQGSIDNLTGEIDPGSFDADLAPEYSRDASVAASRDFGAARLTTTLFYQDVDDAIYRFTGLNAFGAVTTSYKNIANVRQLGAEIRLEVSDLWADGLDLDLGIARIDARTVRNAADLASEDQPFPGVPDWRANGHLRYRMAQRVALSIGWRYASQPNSDLDGAVRGDAFGYRSEYLLVDARVTWKPTDVLEASIGVDNVNDDEAYVVSPLARRTGYAQFRLRF